MPQHIDEFSKHVEALDAALEGVHDARSKLDDAVDDYQDAAADFNAWLAKAKSQHPDLADVSTAQHDVGVDGSDLDRAQRKFREIEEELESCELETDDESDDESDDDTDDDMT